MHEAVSKLWPSLHIFLLLWQVNENLTEHRIRILQSLLSVIWDVMSLSSSFLGCRWVQCQPDSFSSVSHLFFLGVCKIIYLYSILEFFALCWGMCFTYQSRLNRVNLFNIQTQVYPLFPKFSSVICSHCASLFSVVSLCIKQLYIYVLNSCAYSIDILCLNLSIYIFPLHIYICVYICAYMYICIF